MIEDTVSKYQNAWIKVNEDQVIRPDGKKGIFGTVKIKPGVSVLALSEDHFVYLTEEFHYALGKESIEVVSGGVEEHEDPFSAAKRELEEELGIIAEEWTALGEIHPFTSIVNCPVNLFLARKLTFTKSRPESTEIIKTIKVKLDLAIEMVMDGRISHGTSGVLILKVQQLLNRQK